MSCSKSSIWIDSEFRKYYEGSKSTGLALYFDKDVENDMRLSIIGFISWLRKKYYFPIRCSMFFEDIEKFKSKSEKNYCQGIFFSPEDFYRARVPRIYVAVKTDTDWVLYTIAHELTHYFQWYFLEDQKRTDRSLEIEANKYASWIVWEYLNNNH